MRAASRTLSVVLCFLPLLPVKCSPVFGSNDPIHIIMHDETSPTWNLAPLDEVLMDVHNTGNYQLNGSQADAQWEALIPANGGLVRLGPHQELFMVSMYHQLKCLDIIRRDYVFGSMGKNGTDPLTRHCLNYIRQMVLCRGDRRLECVVDPFGEHAVQVRGTQTCHDWRQVYDHFE
ncbi:hypothetical protein B0H17DRAFT_1007303 [Mycena rosella]|uniref:Uncharacterized protein n=1 Tax=Mycena rosella TaxID=1033263 RepID=A0AAD7GN91_MYCRO|nr:hypothetical protein B0H17DRAFT_1007303 [Mycena rosella]